MKNTIVAASVMFALAVATVSQVDADTLNGTGQGLFYRISHAVAPQESSVMEAPAPAADYADPGTIVQMPAGAWQAAGPCDTCCCQSCCCPVPVRMCLVDPCGCPHDVCVDVPPCCAGQQPVVCWRSGLFGRQIASVCWPCCDKEVKVVVTKHGKVRVRG